MSRARRILSGIFGIALIACSVLAGAKAYRDGYVFDVYPSTVQSNYVPGSWDKAVKDAAAAAVPVREQKPKKANKNPARDKKAPAREHAAPVKPATPGRDCATVRWAVATFSPAQLEQMKKQYKVTPAEEAEAKKCLP